MKKKVVVLGCGMVGAVMARDLAEESGFEITVADFNPDSLDTLRDTNNIETIQTDLSTPEAVRGVVADFDLVVGAMPSVFGHQTVRAVIESGKSFTVHLLHDRRIRLHSTISPKSTASPSCTTAAWPPVWLI